MSRPKLHLSLVTPLLLNKDNVGDQVRLKKIFDKIVYVLKLIFKNYMSLIT